MNYSALPQYPFEPPEPPQDEDAEGDVDWHLCLAHLLIRLVVVLAVAALACILAVLASAGQILGLFDRLL